MRRFLQLFASSALSVVAAQAFGSPPTEKALLEWLRQERELALIHPDFTGAEISYTIEHHPTWCAPEALASLRRETAGRPDHPGRFDVEACDRYLRDGPSLEEAVVWSAEPTRWRYSIFHVRPVFSFAYFDAAKTGETLWSLTAERLTVYDDKHPAPPGRAVDHVASSIKAEIGSFVHGPLWMFYEPAMLAKPSVRIDDDGWEVAATSESGVSARAAGSWDAALARGFVDSVEYSTPGAGGETFRCTSTGWHADEVLGTWVAERVENHYQRPIGKKVLILNSVIRCDDKRLEAALAVPDLSRPDPIRGPLTITRVDDFRGRGVAPQSVSLAGARPRTLLESLATLRVEWIAAGVLVVSVVGLFLYRKHQGGAL
jgi:hypothetical protein